MNAFRRWIDRWLHALWTSDVLAVKAARFGMAGLLSGLIFAIVSIVCAGLLGWEPKLASAAGYVSSMPVNFAANRHFSFRSQGAFWGDLARFVLLHACNMLLTAFVTGVVVDLMRLHYMFGTAAVVVIVPCVNFAAMNFWVFRKTNSSQSNI